MPDPNTAGILSTENLTNSPWSQGQTPPANTPAPAPNAAPPAPKGIAHGILRGALAAATAMAGPDANGKPRHGLGPIFGGVLAGAMTGLAAGADRSGGQTGGGLAAAGRGFQAVQQKNKQAQQQKFENDQETAKLQLEKAANARAQQEVIMHQHEMGRLDQELQLRRDEFDENKKTRLATLKLQNDNRLGYLNEIHAVPVVGAPEEDTDEALREWATKNMKQALGNFDTIPSRNPETGKWTLYEIPHDQEISVDVNGQKRFMPADAATIQWAAKYEAERNEKGKQLEIDKIEAQIRQLEAQTKSRLSGAEINEREEALQERKDELAEKVRKDKAGESKTAGGQSESVRKSEPTVSQGIGNLLRGKDFSAPIVTTTQMVRGAQAAVPSHIPVGTTATNPATGAKIVMGGDGQWHPTQQQ